MYPSAGSVAYLASIDQPSGIDQGADQMKNALCRSSTHAADGTPLIDICPVTGAKYFFPRQLIKVNIYMAGLANKL